MVIGIIGLGTIGGSLAKTFRSETEHSVLGADHNGDTLAIASISGVIDGVLDERSIASCDYLFLCLYPLASVEYLERMQKFIPKNCVVVDCCGIKRAIFPKCRAIAEANGFVYIGGHPMAGAVKPGFVSAREKMFKGASMVLVPGGFDDLPVLDGLIGLLREVGFSRIITATPEEHDYRIAFTSQLPHVISNAYVKSPAAKGHRGFSGGSYRDLSRVAKVNVPLWTELFLENADKLSEELDVLIGHLEEYRDAIRAGDAETLSKLLQDGADQKDLADKG